MLRDPPLFRDHASCICHPNSFCKSEVSRLAPRGHSCTQQPTLLAFGVFLVYVCYFLSLPSRNSSQESRPALSGSLPRPPLGQAVNLPLELPPRSGFSPRVPRMGLGPPAPAAAPAAAAPSAPGSAAAALPLHAAFYSRQQAQPELEAVPGREGLAGYDHSQVNGRGSVTPSTCPALFKLFKFPLAEALPTAAPDRRAAAGFGGEAALPWVFLGRVA